MTGPERIWIDADGAWHTVNPSDWKDVVGGEYVRADLSPQAVRVKGLVWERGMVDWAKPMPGMKYVACSTTPTGSWAWWLDGAPETRSVHLSEGAAKAAAQADYEARILDALDLTPDPRVTALMDAARALVDYLDSDEEEDFNSVDLRAALAAMKGGDHG